MSNKRFITIFLTILLGGLIFIGAANFLVDPIFHYHAPLNKISYTMDDERYQNNGIMKHFDYDCIITGTSMVENTKASLVDSLFDVKSVKTCFMGGSYREISENIRVGLKNNPKVKLVIRATDVFDLISDADKHPSTDPNSTFEYPFYITDDNLINDVEYLLNKSLLSDTVKAVTNTLKGVPGTDFDDYMYWQDMYTFGRDVVLRSYVREQKQAENTPLTEEEEKLVRTNIEKNIISLAGDYPEVTFIVWIPPYSIAYYDTENMRGKLLKDMEAVEIELGMLSEVSNIEAYCFMDRTDWILNLDRYKDVQHYDAAMNDEIMNAIAKGEGRITKDNIHEYMEGVRKLYLEFDYDSIYE